jgi:hypothetical protein
MSNPTPNTMGTIKKTFISYMNSSEKMYAQTGMVEETDKSISPEIMSKPMPRTTIPNSGINLSNIKIFPGLRKI